MVELVGGGSGINLSSFSLIGIRLVDMGRSYNWLARYSRQGLLDDEEVFISPVISWDEMQGDK